ncbi:hypothetical protein [Enteroscipio rubneri]|nr:hypothetical protein [Enteroscipio rubneri]
MWRIIVEISSVAEACVTCAEIDMSDPIGWTVRMAGGGTPSDLTRSNTP